MIPDHFRLYLHLEFTDYVDIPIDSVLHVVNRPSVHQDGLGGVCMWIKADTPVIAHSISHTQADFLSGELMNVIDPSMRFFDVAGFMDARPKRSCRGSCISRPV